MKNFENIITYQNYKNQHMSTIKKNDHLFDLTKIDDKILIKDGSDGYYKEMFTREELSEILDELKMWINND